MKEVWKDIPTYEGYYQVSNIGNVRSLDRVLNRKNGSKVLVKSQPIKKAIGKHGYYRVKLNKNGIQKHPRVHQLVATSFLGHVINGQTLVINHINFLRHDNRVENLEIVTMRENGNKKHLKSSSKFIGVHYDKPRDKWRAAIMLNGVRKHLGRFKTEEEANDAYQVELKEHFIN